MAKQRAKQRIRFVLDTLWDIKYSDKIDPLFQYFELLINNGHELAFYALGIDEEEKDIPVIATIDHLHNFRRSMAIEMP
jgi:hypothetical protein